MPMCPACGQENPEGFRFCGSCGKPLADEAPRPREERKVVTVLFADLVGFTGRAEQLDPEDVRAMLSPYYARLRSRTRAARRDRREVHRRCGHGRFRRAGGPRGRPRAGGAGCACDPGRDSRRGRWAPGSDRRQHRRGARLPRREAERRGGHGSRRRRQHDGQAAVGRTRERHSRRRKHIPRHPPRNRVSRSHTGRGEREGRPCPGVGSRPGLLSDRSRNVGDRRATDRPPP